MKKEYLTFCHICPGHCSRKMTVEDGKIVSIDLDKESGLPTQFCPYTRGRQVMEVCAHPDRLKYPQRRVGPKGSGQWQRISWDEALNAIVQNLKEVKEKYGPERVAFLLGEPKGMEFAFAQRFATAFGTPNVVTPGSYCGVPRGAGNSYTCGRVIAADEKNRESALVVLWGCNFIHTSGAMTRETFNALMKNGSKLVVIDPKKIDVAKRADLWIAPRPQSDGALAMGLLKVLIDEGLYDHDFVSKWTVGFSELREHVKTFALEDIERLTWVPKNKITELARMYATLKPARTLPGNGLERNMNAFQTIRALTIVSAITGNLNVHGGDIFLIPAPFTRGGNFYLMKIRNIDNMIGHEFPIARHSAYVPPQSIVSSILEEKPYAIKAALCILSDPLMSYPDTQKTFEALKKLDFLVVSEIFMTPTAAVADIVLPAAWGVEHDTVGYWPGRHEEIRAYPKIIEPPGEAWSDAKWMNEVANRLGLDHFWVDEKEALNVMLEPSGLTWEEFKEKRVLKARKDPGNPEDGIFKTTSGKVEIYSERLKKMGISPMTVFEELSKFAAEPSEQYPLLMFNAKEKMYMLTGFKQVPRARTQKPEPIVELNPDTAAKAGIKEGDWVYIESNKGRIMQKLALDPELDPKLVYASFGWWFPEDPDDHYQFRKSNINVLIGNDPPYEPATGAAELGGIPCRVYRAK